MVEKLDLPHCDQPIDEIDEIHLHVNVGGSGNFETALKFFHERCNHMSISCFSHCL